MKKEKALKSIENIIKTANYELDKLYEQVKCGKMDAGMASETIEECIMKKNSEILKEHAEFCGIWQSKDGKHWRTKVPTDIEGNGSKLISLTTRENLEKAILKHYMSMYNKHQTLESVHVMWRELRLKLARSSDEPSPKLGTLNKHDNIWSRYFEGTKLVKQDISKLTNGMVKDWLIDTNCSNNLSAKQFEEIRTLLRLLFDYAADHDMLTVNVPRQMRQIEGLSFRKTCKNANVSEQERIELTVYTSETKKYLIDKANEMFEKTGNTAYLGIILNTKLGVRVGELVAIMGGDVIGNQIHICKSEVEKRYLDSEGRIHRDGFEVVSHTKTPDGDRYMPLTPEGKEIIERIKAANAKRGFTDENGYLFINTKGERMHENSINNALAELNGGRKKVDENIKNHRPHGNHSLRRTIISDLHDSKILSDEELRSWAGHTDINTTRRYYIHPTKTLDSHIDELTRILDA